MQKKLILLSFLSVTWQASTMDQVASIAADRQAMSEKICAQCSVQASFRCTKCKNIFYCSVACQRQNWKQHKESCITPEEQAKQRFQKALIITDCIAKVRLIELEIVVIQVFKEAEEAYNNKETYKGLLEKVNKAVLAYWQYRLSANEVSTNEAPLLTALEIKVKECEWMAEQTNDNEKETVTRTLELAREEQSREITRVLGSNPRY